MTAARGQLYVVYDHVELPNHVIRSPSGERIGSVHFNRLPVMHWPDGGPCEAANAYLIEQHTRSTGDTVITYAVELSHLIRFCGERYIGFDTLSDDALWEWSKSLQTEKSSIHPAERARNNNTVRAIIRRGLNFLMWYQDWLIVPGDQPLIGAAEVAPRIVVAIKNNKRNSKYYFAHRCMPEDTSVEPKGVMPLSIIENIEKKIDELSIIDYVKEAALRRYAGDKARLNLELEYVRARRRFMIWIMKRTGLRPAELSEMPFEQNRDVLQSKRLVIPTKKRRKNVAPMRSFPITLKDATYFARYLTSRDAFVRGLKRLDDRPPSPALMLSRDGSAIKKTSIEKDFQRLSKAAGYVDVQSCLSMFRHRFITFEVIAHLKEFMAGTGKTRHLMTDSDYRSILHRVVTKTGHGSADSLWHYIHLAWDEMDVWGNVDRTLERLRAADALFEELLDLRHELAAGPRRSAVQVLDHVTARLSSILADARAGAPIN